MQHTRTVPGRPRWSGVDCPLGSFQIYSKTRLPCSRTLLKAAKLPAAVEKADSRLVNKAPDLHPKYTVPLEVFSIMSTHDQINTPNPPSVQNLHKENKIKTLKVMGR